MRIREITPADDKQMADIVRCNLKTHDLAIPGTAYFDPELDSLSTFYHTDPARRKYWILEDENGEAAGGIGLAPFAAYENCAELQKLYLTDRVKGQGYGRQLIAKIEETARQMGYARMYLETHHNLYAAICLYRKCGYEEIQPELVQHTTMDTFFMKEL